MEYTVAYGISSSIAGKKVFIGSVHFIFEDEGCVCQKDMNSDFPSAQIKTEKMNKLVDTN